MGARRVWDASCVCATLVCAVCGWSAAVWATVWCAQCSAAVSHFRAPGSLLVCCASHFTPCCVSPPLAPCVLVLGVRGTCWVCGRWCCGWSGGTGCGTAVVRFFVLCCCSSPIFLPSSHQCGTRGSVEAQAPPAGCCSLVAWLGRWMCWLLLCAVPSTLTPPLSLLHAAHHSACCGMGVFPRCASIPA